MKISVQVLVGYNNSVIDIAEKSKPFNQDFLETMGQFDKMRLATVEVEIPDFNNLAPIEKA